MELLTGLSLHVDHQDPEMLTSTQYGGISTGLRSLFSPPWTGREISDHEVNGTLLPNQGIHYMWRPGSSLGGPISADGFCGEIPYYFSEPDATALLDHRVAGKWAPDYSRVVRLAWKHYRGLYPTNPEFSGLDKQPMVFANRLRMALCSDAGGFEGWPALAVFVAERAVAGRLSGYSQSPLRNVNFD